MLRYVLDLTMRCGVNDYLSRYLSYTSLDSGHNGHKPKRPKPKRPQTETATNRNGHRPKRPQTETATDRNGHKPKRPQTGTATNRNGYKPKRPQTGTATNRNRHNYIWFSGLQMYVLNRSFKLVSRPRQKLHSVTSEHGYGARIWTVTGDSIYNIYM